MGISSSHINLNDGRIRRTITKEDIYQRGPPTKDATLVFRWQLGPRQVDQNTIRRHEACSRRNGDCEQQMRQPTVRVIVPD